MPEEALIQLELEQQQSYDDFTGKAFAAIDTIYYDNRVKLQQVSIDARQWRGVWTSDHFPVIAYFLFAGE